MGRTTRKVRPAEDVPQNSTEFGNSSSSSGTPSKHDAKATGLIRCKPMNVLLSDDSNFMDNQIQFDFEENSISQPFCDTTTGPPPTRDTDPVQPKECTDDAVSISSDSEDGILPDKPIKEEAPVKSEIPSSQEPAKATITAFTTPARPQNRKFALKGNYRKVTDFFSTTPSGIKSAAPSGKENINCVAIKKDISAKIEIKSPVVRLVPYNDSSKRRDTVTRFNVKRGPCRTAVSTRFHEENRSRRLNNKSPREGSSNANSKPDESSRFPVTISGDFDVDRFANLLRESDPDSRLQIKVDDQRCIFIETVRVFDKDIEDLLLTAIRRVLSEVDGFSVEERHIEDEERVQWPAKDATEPDTISISSSLSDAEDKEYIPKPEVPDDESPKRGAKRKKSKAPGKSKAIKAPTKTKREKRPCPSYKIVRGTEFAVDAFRYGNIEGVSCYFLSHFHSDHYIGLTKKFANTVYMSTVTANLVRKIIKVEDRFIVEMSLNVPVVVQDVEVTAVEANHCPGAVMFLFKLPSGECILHVGDFRASPEMETEPIFWNNHISLIYLDTTYLSCKYDHPTQIEAIDRMICSVKEYQERHIGVKYVIVLGTYVIGKEKVWSGLARHLGCRVWLEKSRLAAVECQEDASLLQLVEVDPAKALIHVLPLQNVFYEKMVEYLGQFEDTYTHALAIRPSGWERNTKPRRRGAITFLGVQYSEHSSYSELERFVRYLQPEEAISTVPIGADPAKVPRIPSRWLKKDVKPRRKGQQTITSFLKAKKPMTSSQDLDQSESGTNLTNLSMQIQTRESFCESDWLD